VSVTALDALATLNEVKISTEVHQGVRTGEAIGLVLDAVGWPAGLRDLDVGATTIRWWWEQDVVALEALVKIVNSEGPGAFIHADPDGQVVFRDRHHRLIRPESATSQATFTGDVEPCFSDPFVYDHGLRDIINVVALSVEERDPSAESETVWESDQIHNISPSQTLALRVETSDPVISAAMGYSLRAGSVTAAQVTPDSGQALQVSVTAGVAGAQIDGLHVTARPVAVRRTYQVQHEDAGSQATYGKRSGGAPEVPWAGIHDADAIAQIVIGTRAQRLPIVSMRVISKNAERLEQQLSRDLSDRIHITERETGLDNDFYVEQIQHTILSGGAAIETTFGCEKAPVQPSNVFRFDVTGAGFDDGVFGSLGLDEPQQIFCFDVTGAGFNDGVFAT
jgi:hypothetical protein